MEVQLRIVHLVRHLTKYVSRKDGTELRSPLKTYCEPQFLLGHALANRHEALLLDEPTSSLDIPASFHYLDMARKLMQQGTQIILVTHHIHEIPPEITRVIFMRKGRVVADGRKQELLRSAPVSELFGCKVDVVERNGFFQALPGE